MGTPDLMAMYALKLGSAELRRQLYCSFCYNLARHVRRDGPLTMVQVAIDSSPRLARRSSI
ncbi:MAG: hypothetical protein ACM65L_16400 [Microcoleus sp.]